jgi:replicative DNA helicase
MAELLEANRPADLVTLADAFGKRNEISVIGGVAYLASLTEGLPRRVSPDDWVNILIEKSKLRRIIALSTKVISESYCGRSAAEVSGDWESSMLAILDGNEQDEPLVKNYTVPLLDRLVRERNRQPGLLGLSYGVQIFDEFTSGAIHGEMSIIGARPGVGKTTMLIQAAVVNCSLGIPAVIFSYEMSREQLLRRIYAQVANVAFSRIRDPRLATLEDMHAIQMAAAEVAEWPLRIYDDSEMPLSQMCSIIRLCIRKHKARLIGVDYAQIVPADGRDDKTRVSKVAYALARVVKHEDAAMMLLSQLRKPSNAEGYGKIPHSADLRETGAIEDAAHMICLLHRPWDTEHNRIADEGQFIIAKQRNGDTGSLDVNFNRRLVRFEGA